VKKVAVGDNHPWLSRMLREVTLLESLRHPNIVVYKHAWLEMCCHSSFGPQVPTLFILMEHAAGGNLEDYLVSETTISGDFTPKEAAIRTRNRSKEMALLPKLSEAWTMIDEHGGMVQDQGRQLRFLSYRALVSISLGIARGLQHLHNHLIVHRDLKPPNILLSWEKDGNHLIEMQVSLRTLYCIKS
jgi:serine/threonine protein kinase